MNCCLRPGITEALLDQAEFSGIGNPRHDPPQGKQVSGNDLLVGIIGNLDKPDIDFKRLQSVKTAGIFSHHVALIFLQPEAAGLAQRGLNPGFSETGVDRQKGALIRPVRHHLCNRIGNNLRRLCKRIKHRQSAGPRNRRLRNRRHCKRQPPCNCQTETYPHQFINSHHLPGNIRTQSPDTYPVFTIVMLRPMSPKFASPKFGEPVLQKRL